MTEEGLLEITDIQDSLIIDRKFVLVDSSKYTEEAFSYILTKIDEVGSIGFISDLIKIYAQGQFYSDFDTLKFFQTIKTGEYDSNGNFVLSYTFDANKRSDELKFIPKGYTKIELDADNNAVIINTDLSDVEDNTKSILERLERIENTYATQEYVADNYQEILIPGAYIQINEDNVITTYDLVSYSYAFENYATYSYIAENNEYFYNFERYVRNNYADRIETKEIAFEEAEKAVAKVVDGAPNVFDTLKEIAQWIIDSGEYVLVNPEDLDTSGNTKYYVKEYTEVDKTKIDRSGQTDYYEYKSIEVYKPVNNEDINKESDTEYYINYEGQYVKVNNEDINTELGTQYYIKEISEPDYRLVLVSDMDLEDENKKYYTLDYVDAQYPLITTGEIDYYIYSSTSAAEILGEITDLQEKVGQEYYFYYLTEDNQKKIYEGTVSTLTHLQDNNYLLEDNDGNIYEVSYVSSTGLFNKIEVADKELSDRIDEVNDRLNEILDEFNAILYKLSAGTTTSYAYLTFDEYEYKGWPERQIIMNIVEADFDNNPESSYYGQVTNNGLTTSYTVNSMLDYRNGWIILSGAEEKEEVEIIITLIKLVEDLEENKLSLEIESENEPEDFENLKIEWHIFFDGLEIIRETYEPVLEFNDELKDRYEFADNLTVYIIINENQSDTYTIKSI